MAMNTTLTERYARSKKDRIQTVMEAAGEKGVWLTLAELSSLTNSPEASISALLRKLRSEGFEIVKRIRSAYVREYLLAPPLKKLPPSNFLPPCA
jgi:hypothetical protein